MKDLARDARFGLRLLARSPGFAAAVVVALGLGIGSATAIWSGVRAVALAPLPYPDSDRLMFVSRAYPGFPQGGGNFSYPALADIASWNRSFDVFAGYQAYGALALSGGQEPVRLNVNWVAPAYLELLGLRPELGRALRASEDRYVDGDPVVVLSHDVWQRQFGGSPNIVGTELVLNDRTFTVVGVAPPEFRDAPAEQELGEPIEGWVPLGLAHEVLGQFGPQDRAGAILWALARRKSGVSVAQARADVAGLGQKMARVYPATDRGFGLVARPLKDQLVGELYAPLRLLGAGALFLLLIGCANAGNLLLARLLTRQREFAVRAAHGATSRRLAAQVVVENLVLALASGALGLALASAGVEAVRHGVAGGLSPVVRFALDGRLVLAGVALTLATGLLVGLLPAVLRSRAPLTDALNQGGRSAAPSVRQTTVRALVAGEVALAVVLLAGAGLLWKSVRNLTTWDLGFRTENLLTLRLDLRSQRYTDPESRARFGRQVAEELGRVPGAASVTLLGPSMLGRATWVIEARNEGAPDDPSNLVMSSRHSVNPGALANLGIALRRGRDFRWNDDARAPLVAIVSESTAKSEWPGQDPIGKRFRALRLPGWATVVGVAADARHRQRIDLTDAANGVPPGGLGPQRDVYFPYLQLPNPSLVVAVRTSGEATGVASGLRAAIHRLDPALPVYDIALLQDRLARQERGSRVLATIAGAFAALALALAALGLYGVLAHAVARRTPEIGVRRALGAPARSVLGLVLREGLAPAAAGAGAGLAAALFLTRGISSLLYGLTPADPEVFAAIGAALLAVAAAACVLPARRAMRVDPMVAIRGDGR